MPGPGGTNVAQASVLQRGRVLSQQLMHWNAKDAQALKVTADMQLTRSCGFLKSPHANKALVLGRPGTSVSMEWLRNTVPMSSGVPIH